MTVINIPGLSASSTGGTPVNDTQNFGVLFVNSGELQTDSGLLYDTSLNKLTIGSMLTINAASDAEGGIVTIQGSGGATPGISLESHASDECLLSTYYNSTRVFQLLGDGTLDLSLRNDTDTVLFVRASANTPNDNVNIAGWVKVYEASTAQTAFIPLYY